MNYQNFIKKTNNQLIKLLLEKLSLLQRHNIFIKIDNTPNYNLSQYVRERLTNYYFQNSWNFKHEFNFIIEAKFYESGIFHFDQIQDLKKTYQLKFSSEFAAFSDIVSEAYKLDKESFTQFSFEPSLDNYNLNTLEVLNIDNLKKEVVYRGSFWGDSNSIDPIDYELITRVEIYGLEKSFDKLDLHFQLIVEAFLLQAEHKHKLAYFLTYSALENFVNTILNSHDVDTRFKDKLKDLIKGNIPNFTSNKIYTSLIGQFKNFTNVRNTIVHGKNEIIIDGKLSSDFLGYVLILIALYKWKDNDFLSLYKRIIS